MCASGTALRDARRTSARAIVAPTVSLPSTTQEIHRRERTRTPDPAPAPPPRWAALAPGPVAPRPARREARLDDLRRRRGGDDLVRVRPAVGLARPRRRRPPVQEERPAPVGGARARGGVAARTARPPHVV